jgi:hypothetical protein
MPRYRFGYTLETPLTRVDIHSPAIKEVQGFLDSAPKMNKATIRWLRYLNLKMRVTINACLRKDFPRVDASRKCGYETVTAYTAQAGCWSGVLAAPLYGFFLIQRRKRRNSKLPRRSVEETPQKATECNL